ncbi:MAG TPA: helix-turn-helix domain-containing protein [Steroidobacteraceae bacterium]
MRTVDGRAGGMARGAARSTAASAAASGAETRIARSWARCARSYHLAPDRNQAPFVLEAGRLRERIQGHEELLGVARAEMDLLYDQIAGSGYALLLTDASGVILCQKVDPTLERLFKGAGLLPGADWSERSEGTNGIGTCLAELRPVTVHRDEHFSSYHIGLSCSGALIRDPLDQVVAVLDASCVGAHDFRVSQMHTMTLVNMSAQVIEKCLFLQRHRQHTLLRFHWRPEFVNLMHDGALALDRDGRVVAADRAALALLGFKSRAELLGCAIDQIFTLPNAELGALGRRVCSSIWPLRDLSRGHRFFLSLQDTTTAVAMSQAARLARKPAHAAGRPEAAGAHQAPTLDSEHTQLLTAIERSRWNMTQTAELLGISRNTLYRKIKQFGIPLPHARRS